MALNLEDISYDTVAAKNKYTINFETLLQERRHDFVFEQEKTDGRSVQGYQRRGLTPKDELLDVLDSIAKACRHLKKELDKSHLRELFLFKELQTRNTSSDNVFPKLVEELQVLQHENCRLLHEASTTKAERKEDKTFIEKLKVSLDNLQKEIRHLWAENHQLRLATNIEEYSEGILHGKKYSEFSNQGELQNEKPMEYDIKQKKKIQKVEHELQKTIDKLEKSQNEIARLKQEKDVLKTRLQTFTNMNSILVEQTEKDVTIKPMAVPDVAADAKYLELLKNLDYQNILLRKRLAWAEEDRENLKEKVRQYRMNVQKYNLMPPASHKIISSEFHDNVDKTRHQSLLTNSSEVHLYNDVDKTGHQSLLPNSSEVHLYDDDDKTEHQSLLPNSSEVHLYDDVDKTGHQSLLPNSSEVHLYDDVDKTGHQSLLPNSSEVHLYDDVDKTGISIGKQKDCMNFKYVTSDKECSNVYELLPIRSSITNMGSGFSIDSQDQVFPALPSPIHKSTVRVSSVEDITSISSIDDDEVFNQEKRLSLGGIIASTAEKSHKKYSSQNVLLIDVDDIKDEKTLTENVNINSPRNILGTSHILNSSPSSSLIDLKYSMSCTPACLSSNLPLFTDVKKLLYSSSEDESCDESKVVLTEFRKLPDQIDNPERLHDTSPKIVLSNTKDTVSVVDHQVIKPNLVNIDPDRNVHEHNNASSVKNRAVISPKNRVSAHVSGYVKQVKDLEVKEVIQASGSYLTINNHLCTSPNSVYKHKVCLSTRDQIYANTIIDKYLRLAPK